MLNSRNSIERQRGSQAGTIRSVTELGEPKWTFRADEINRTGDNKTVSRAP